MQVKNKLSLEDIEAAIVSEQYTVFPNTTLTVCCLTLANGFNATGESACIDPTNFVRSAGEKLARINAVNKVWMLEGYLLKQQLHEAEPNIFAEEVL